MKMPNPIVTKGFYISCLCLLTTTITGQVLIEEMEFDGGDRILFTIDASDCDNNPGTFGANGNGAFEINDREGEDCCPCAFSGGSSECGDNGSAAISQIIPIDRFCNVTVRADVSLSNAVFECDMPGFAPITPFPCNPTLDAGRDAMKIEILTPLNGIQLLGGYCGDQQIEDFIIEGIEDILLTIFITGGTEAQDESYFIQRIIVEGSIKSLVQARLDAKPEFCNGQESLVINAIAEPGSTYEWEFNGNPLNLPPNTPTYIQALAAPSHAGLYTVTVFEPGGCISTAQTMVDIVTCIPSTATFSFDTNFCRDEDSLMLPPTSDEGVTGNWNVNPVQVLADTSFFDEITFTPGPQFGIAPVTIALDVDTLPILGDFPSGGLDVCVLEGSSEQVDFSSLLNVREPRIFEATGFDGVILDVMDLRNLDVSDQDPGTYKFTFRSEPAGNCGEKIDSVDITLIRLNAGQNASFVHCAEDNDPVDFQALINDPSMSGRWSDIQNSGIILTDPTSVDVSSLAVGNYIYQYIVGGDSSCLQLSDTSELQLEVIPGASLNVGTFVPAVVLCENSDTVFIIGNDRYDSNQRSGQTLLPGQAANSCDSLVIVNLNFLPILRDTVLHRGCIGDGYDTLINNVLYFEDNRAGTEILTASNGCDSIITINLTFGSPTFGTFSPTRCTGDGFEQTIGGIAFNEQNKTGTAIITGSNGCDSTVTVNIEFLPPETKAVPYDGCINDGYFIIVNGVRYDENNPTGTEQIRASTGCDTLVDINLVFKPDTTGAVDIVRRQDDGFFIEVGSTVYDENNPTGTEVFTAANGCDSIVTVNLTFLEGVFDSLVTDRCMGDDFEYISGNSIYNESNPSGVDTFSSSDNRDSFFITRLTFLPPGINQIDLFKTSGSGFDTIINGIRYDESIPSNMDTIQGGAVNSCDSIIIVNIQFLDALRTRIDTTICFEDEYSITVGNSTYGRENPSGLDTFQSSLGIDSFVITDLHFPGRAIMIFDTLLCSGDPFEFVVGNKVYNESNQSGLDTLVGATAYQCDSFIQTLLRYADDIQVTVMDTICPGDQIAVGNSIYNVDNLSGMDTIPGVVGCDTVVTVNLSIDTISYSIDVFPSCPNAADGILTVFNDRPIATYLLSIDNQTYTISVDPVEIAGLSGGQYELMVESTLGCRISESIIIDEFQIDAPQINTEVVGLDSQRLDIEFQGIIDSISWSSTSTRICSNCPSIIIDPRITETYTVDILESSGCTFSTSLQVGDGSPIPVRFYMPNTISPNVTTANSRLYLQTSDPNIVSYDLFIYNRWGDLLFENFNVPPNEFNGGWDGTNRGIRIEQGVYVYLVEILKRDGQVELNTGDILVIY